MCLQQKSSIYVLSISLRQPQPHDFLSPWQIVTNEKSSFYSLEKKGIIRFSKASKPALPPTHFPIKWVPGARSSWLKRPKREADH
jgi:hypothetical protein